MHLVQVLGLWRVSVAILERLEVGRAWFDRQRMNSGRLQRVGILATSGNMLLNDVRETLYAQGDLLGDQAQRERSGFLIGS